MSPAVVLSFEHGRIRRVLDTGFPADVMTECERVLDHEPELLDEAREAFYARAFWQAVEDEALCDRTGALDGRLGSRWS